MDNKSINNNEGDIRVKPSLLLLSVFVIATCGLIYELVAGTLASYVLGDSVTQFSTIIGTYLFAMGVGSYFSRFIEDDIFSKFVTIELLIALIGGFSSSILFVLFEQVTYFRLIMYFLVFVTGLLVGLEIPLLMRMLKDNFSFSDLVSEIFTFDYIGALLASLIFPLFFVPYIGLIRTSLFFGLLNAGVACWVCNTLSKKENPKKALRFLSLIVIVILFLGFIFANKIQDFSEELSYNDRVIFSKSTPYQRIVITRRRNDIRLYLNNNLQFSSKDEYRYHESLVHPLMSALENKDTIVILGGGDGLAAREVFKYPNVKKVILVDLDPAVNQLFTSHEMLTKLNKNVFKNPKMEVINQDAFTWLLNQNHKFAAFIIDFPDPSNFSVGKLYSLTFYNRLFKNLKDNGIVVIQSTSPLVAPKSFWCVEATLKAAGFLTIPFHTFVPAFGDWGYVMASKQPLDFNQPLPDSLGFYSTKTFEAMCSFSKDMVQKDVEINRLNNQTLVRYFEEEWGKLN